jgi:tetratricopeptide (TPR) repeat protein
MLINMGGESLDTALDNARQQATDARAIGWWEAEVDALNQSGMFNVLLGRLAEAESELRQALARLATESVNYRTSITLERLALACTLTGALCDAVEFAERGLATARAEGAAEFSLTVHLGAIAAASRLVGDQGRAEQAMAQALAAAREINAGHIEAILVTLWARLSRDGNGDLREALADCRRGRAVLDRSPDRRAACHAAMTEATLLAELGDFPQALSCLAAAETVAKETAGQLWGEWLLTAGIIRLGAGDLTGGDAAATEAIDHASAGGMRVYEAQARLVRAEALMRQGEVEAAGAEAERAQGMYAEMGHKLCPRPVSWLPNVMWP